MDKKTQNERERAKQVDEILQAIFSHGVVPSSIEVKFNYSQEGERPENIDKLLQIAKAKDINVEDEYRKLVFHFDR